MVKFDAEHRLMGTCKNRKSIWQGFKTYCFNGGGCFACNDCGSGGGGKSDSDSISQSKLKNRLVSSRSFDSQGTAGYRGGGGGGGRTRA